MEERGEGGNSREEAAGGAVLCGVWKGQLDSLQAAMAQNHTLHAHATSDTHLDIKGLNFINGLPTRPSVSMNKIVSPLAERIGL